MAISRGCLCLPMLFRGRQRASECASVGGWVLCCVLGCTQCVFGLYTWQIHTHTYLQNRVPNQHASEKKHPSRKFDLSLSRHDAQDRLTDSQRTTVHRAHGPASLSLASRLSTLARDHLSTCRLHHPPCSHTAVHHQPARRRLLSSCFISRPSTAYRRRLGRHMPTTRPGASRFFLIISSLG